MTSLPITYLQSLKPDSLFIRSGRWKVWTHEAVASAQHELYLGWAPYGDGLPDRIARVSIPCALVRDWALFTEVARQKFKAMQLMLEGAFES